MKRVGMRFSPTRRCVTGAVAALLLLAAFPATAKEQRCQELGSSCMCSEPLNTSNWTRQGFDPPRNTYWVNPDDSPSSSECGKGNTGTWYRESSLVVMPETGMPAGNSVDWVWRNTSTGGGESLNGDPRVPSGTRRMCIRVYFRQSSDFQTIGDGTCDDTKLMELNFDTGGFPLHNLQINTPSPAAQRWAMRLNFPNLHENISYSGQNKVKDCNGVWCRAEVCLSGNYSNGSNFSADGYIEIVTGPSAGNRIQWNRRQLGNAAGSVSQFNTVWLPNMFREGIKGGGRCLGYREISHAMQAAWTSDSGQYIGAAYEVEGQSGGSAPPPDNSPPPPADPPPADPPAAEAPAPPPSSGPLTLDASVRVDGSNAVADAAVAGGVGPYEILFDCGNDGHWDGTFSYDDATTAQYECPNAGGTRIRVFVWDKVGGSSLEELVSTEGLAAAPAPPAAPVLLRN